MHRVVGEIQEERLFLFHRLAHRRLRLKGERLGQEDLPPVVFLEPVDGMIGSRAFPLFLSLSLFLFLLDFLGRSKFCSP